MKYNATEVTHVLVVRVVLADVPVMIKKHGSIPLQPQQAVLEAVNGEVKKITVHSRRVRKNGDLGVDPYEDEFFGGRFDQRYWPEWMAELIASVIEQHVTPSLQAHLASREAKA